MAGTRRSIALTLVPRGSAHAVPPLVEPAFVGSGSLDYLCGACQAPLGLGMQPGDLAPLVFACACGAANAVPRPFGEPEGLEGAFARETPFPA
jgi:hypothetical protein